MLQTVHLLLERGQPPTESVHAPLTPQCTPPSAANNQDQTKSKEQPHEVKDKPEYSFVTEGKQHGVPLVSRKHQNVKVTHLSYSVK